MSSRLLLRLGKTWPVSSSLRSLSSCSAAAITNSSSSRRPFFPGRGPVVARPSSSPYHSLSPTLVAGGRVSPLDAPAQTRALAMAPTDLAKVKVETLIKDQPLLVFSKSTCPFCHQVKALLAERQLTPHVVELDQLGQEGADMQQALADLTQQKTVPNVFVKGRHLGGADDTLTADRTGKLQAMLKNTTDHGYDYDMVVIGGGSGGLAASKEAARLGWKVAVCDFVTPTPIGTRWGLGGTCVNVGCIPKKLMHQAGLLGEASKDAIAYGWQEPASPPALDWAKLVEGVQNHIGSINWGYRVALRDKSVTYLNEYASFVDAHTLKTVNKKGKESTVTANNFIIATGMRPRYPDIPGAREHGITSDDIFSLPSSPGKTLFVGASYISLECAGFLHAVGLSATVMVRSILLRGFDQQMANKVGDHMEASGINFVRGCVPEKLEKLDDGKIRVTAKYTDGTSFEDLFDTVVFAIGRDAETPKLNLPSVGVDVNPKNGMIPCPKDDERTSCEHIYAIGDVLDGKPELTPVAIQAGVLLARRLAGHSQVLTDYVNIPTTVFTPLEYSCCGLSEEDALAKYGKDDLEVYHKNFWPLEWTVAHRPENTCYAKLICVKSQGEKVVGLHYLGPNAGEVMQGFSGMVIMGASKADFDRLIGIHPTTAEVFTTMDISKSSGVDPSAAGC